MRARYYSLELRRFINADILHGEISDSTSLNRYSYINGNPVSFVDPFGLSAERGKQILYKYSEDIIKTLLNFYNYIKQIELEKTFNYIIEEVTGISQQKHYDRNKFYLDFPDVYSKDDPFFEGWVTETASCHQFSSSNRTNVKYISPDGKYEVIYDENYVEVLDIRDIGTYNYVSPKDDGFGHFVKDVVPWIIWGNSPEDSTTREQRIESFVVYGMQDKSKEIMEIVNNKFDEWGTSIKEWWNDLW